MQDESRACVGVNQLPAAISGISQARTAHTTDVFFSATAHRTSTAQEEKIANLRAVLSPAVGTLPLLLAGPFATVAQSLLPLRRKQISPEYAHVVPFS